MRCSVRSFYCLLFSMNPAFTDTEKRNLLPVLTMQDFPLHRLFALLGIKETAFFTSIKRLKKIGLVVYDRRSKIYYFNSQVLMKNVKYPSTVSNLIEKGKLRYPLLFLFDKRSVVPSQKQAPNIPEGVLYFPESTELILGYATGFKRITFGTIEKGLKEQKDAIEKAQAVGLAKLWNSFGFKKFRKKYVPDYSGRIIGRFKTLLKTAHRDDIADAVKGYWKTDDKFIRSKDYPPNLFFSNINHYIQHNSKSSKIKYNADFYDLSLHDDQFYKDTIVEIRIGQASLEDARYVRDKQKEFTGKAKKSVTSYIKKLRRGMDG